MLYTTSEMEERAQEATSHYRESDDPKMLLVPQLPAHSPWDSGELSPAAMMKAVFPQYEEDAAQDMQNLHHFTQLSRGGQLLLPGECSLGDAAVNSAPVLDFLKQDVERGESLNLPPLKSLRQFQSNRTADLSCGEGLHVKEIVIESSSEEAISEAMDWLENNWHKSQKVFPTGCLPVSMEFTDIDSDSYQQMLNGETVPLPAHGEKVLKPVPIPMKVFLGDGRRYLLVITWPVVEHGTDAYIRLPQIQPGLLQLLKDLPHLVGFQVRKQMARLDRVFGDIVEKELDLPNWLDIGALAVFSGYAPDDISPTMLTATILGGTYLYLDPKINRVWRDSWADTPRLLRMFCYRPLQVLDMLSVVLGSVAVRSIFPDMDAAGYVLETGSQAEIARLSFQWILNSLAGTEVVHSYGRFRYPTRLALLRTIRRVTDGEQSEPLPEVLNWSTLFGDWPLLTRGGPRYLHQVRHHMEKFVKRVHSGEEELVPGIRKDVIKPSAQVSDYLTYRQPALPADRYSDPTHGNAMGLLFHPLSECEVLNLPPRDLKASLLMEEGRKAGRPHRLLLLERLRLHPGEIQRVIKRMDISAESIQRALWIQHLSLYEDLCFMFQRIFDAEPERVFNLERTLNQRLSNTYNHELREVEKLQRQLEIRQQRLKECGEAINAGTSARRVGLNSRLTPFKENLLETKQVPRKRTLSVPFTSLLGPQPQKKQKTKKSSSNVASTSKKRARSRSSRSRAKTPARTVRYRSSTPAPSSFKKKNRSPSPVPGPSKDGNDTDDTVILETTLDESEGDEQHLNISLLDSTRSLLEDPIQPDPEFSTRDSGLKVRVPEERRLELIRKKALAKVEKEKME